MDLLAGHEADLRSGIELVSGMRVERRDHGPTRGRLPAKKPFDAGEVHMQDQPRPVAEWRPSALLRELHEVTSLPKVGPANPDRLERAVAVLARLQQLGFDSDRIFRTIYVDSMAGTVATFAAVPLLLGAAGEGSGDLPEGVPTCPPDWAAVLLGAAESPEGWFKRAADNPEWARTAVRRIFESQGRIANWFLGLPMEELLRWAAPASPEALKTLAAHSAEAVADDRWLYDRFTETYLAAWDFRSLILEWKYLRGEITAPCLPEAMRSRHLLLDDVGREIARQTADGHESRRTRGLTVGSFVRTAVGHLEEGRHATAAAIFDACRQADPSDAEAHNNYGFCLLPEDPSAALEALERAASLGMRLETVNVANRLLAFDLVGRPGTGLELARRFAETGAWETRVSGYLWRPDNLKTSPTIEDVTDIRLYICELALAIARNAGDASEEREWMARAERLEAEAGPLKKA